MFEWHLLNLARILFVGGAFICIIGCLIGSWMIIIIGAILTIFGALLYWLYRKMISIDFGDPTDYYGRR